MLVEVNVPVAQGKEDNRFKHNGTIQGDSK